MFSRGKWTRHDASKEDSNRERRSRQEERVCLRRGENPRGEKNLAFSLSLFFSVVISRKRTGAKRERTEEASEAHEQRMAVAVAAAALPPHH